MQYYVYKSTLNQKSKLNQIGEWKFASDETSCAKTGRMVSG